MEVRAECECLRDPGPRSRIMRILVHGFLEEVECSFEIVFVVAPRASDIQVISPLNVQLVGLGICRIALGQERLLIRR